MKKLLLLSLCFLFYSMQIFAQNRTIRGTVTDKEDGGPLPGVTVKVKGGALAVVTGADGKYSISVPSSATTLVFTFIGYAPLEKPIAGAVVNATLSLASKDLGEVVVTGSLGRKFSEKSEGYAATHIESKDAELTGETNLLNGLTGKVAGLQINTTGSGVDPGVRFVLRGNRSINGNNQALVVVDGVPIPAADVAALDPSTFASYDVLNGGNAGALYGAEGSNGVIVITTVKGTADNTPTVVYQNTLQAAQAYLFPKYQQQFGMYGGETAPYLNPITGATLYVPYENQQYGPAFDGSTVPLGAPAGSASGPQLKVLYAAQSVDPRKNFFNVGYTEQNNISVNSGDAANYFYLSAQNVIIKGIVPNDANQKNSFTVRGGKTYGKFQAQYGLTYTNSQLSQAGNSYNNQSVMYSLDQFPANLDVKQFSDPTSTFANPSDFYDAYATNPYWTVQNSRVLTTRNNILANLTLTYNVTKWLDATYKLSDNFGYYDQRQTHAEVDFTAYAASDPLSAGNIPSGYKTTLNIPGTVSDYQAQGDGNNGYSRLQQDAYLNFHHTFFTDFKANLLLGTSESHQYQKYVSNGATALLVNGLYNVGITAGIPSAAEASYTYNQISFFGDFSLGYKDYAFIEATLRNDHTSLLAADHRQYYFPGISGSYVFTDAIDALKGNKILSYGKLRAAYSQTGQVSVGAYSINNTYNIGTGFPYGALGGLTQSTTNYTDLVPERVTEIEFGTELGFFNNLIHGSLTYYKQNSKNQTLAVGTSGSTGYTSVITNVGELQSSGLEYALTVTPLTKAKNKVGLEFGANLANYESQVISLLPSIPQFNISGGNGNEYAIVGQPYPVIKGTDFNRDAQGRVIVSAVTGYPSLNSTPQILGRTTPEYVLGLTMNVKYKFMTLNVVADYRTGFVVDNGNASSLIFGGVSAYTTQAGRQRFVYPNSVTLDANGHSVPNTNIEVQDGNYGFWQNSAFNSATTPLISSATEWKLREVSLDFNLTQFIKKTKYIKGLNLTFTGRNLLTWLPKSNYWGDPELSADTSNATGFVTNAQVPSQRLMGGDLRITF